MWRRGELGPVAAGALAAALLVTVAAVVAHRPLARGGGRSDLRRRLLDRRGSRDGVAWPRPRSARLDRGRGGATWATPGVPPATHGAAPLLGYLMILLANM